jgi:hypothetical protein
MSDTYVIDQDDDTFVILDQEGSPGLNAAAGASFGWPGLVVPGEPRQSLTLPAAGAFSNASPGSCDTPATLDTVFVITVNNVGWGTVTFHAGVATPVMALSTAQRPANAKVTAIPPASPDAALAGANFTLIDV